MKCIEIYQLWVLLVLTQDLRTTYWGIGDTANP